MAREAGTKIRRPGVLAAMALATAALLTVSACGTAGGGGTTGGQASAHGAAAALHGFVDCVRAHGIPDFPDGSVDAHGIVSFPASAPRIPDSVASACQAYFNQLPPQPVESPPVPQHLFQQLLSFARCMRGHGVTDWPDPAPNGTFFLDSRLVAAGKRGEYRQVQACEQANPGVSGHISIGQQG